MKIKVFTDKKFKDVNGYLVYNEQNLAILIDTANENYVEVLKFTKQNNIKITDIFITHGHFSHIFGINEIVNVHNPKNVFVGKDDLLMLFDADKNTSSFYDIENERWVPDPIKNLKVLEGLNKFQINNFNISTMPFLGHTEGSILIVFPNEKTIFSGDSFFLKKNTLQIFAGNYDEKTFVKNVKFLLKNYPRDFKIYPGHFEYDFTSNDLLNKNEYIKKNIFKFE